MKTLKNLTHSLTKKADLLVLGLMVSLETAFATGTGGDQSFAQLNTFLKSEIAGTGGIMVSILAFLGGITMFFATQYKMTSLFVAIGVPIAIQFGPAVFIGLTGVGAVV